MSLNLTWDAIENIYRGIGKQFSLRANTSMTFEITKSPNTTPVQKKTTFSKFRLAMWKLFDSETPIHSMRVFAQGKVVYRYKGVTASILTPDRVPTSGNKEFIAQWPGLPKAKRKSFIEKVLIPQVRNYVSESEAD